MKNKRRQGVRSQKAENPYGNGIDRVRRRIDIIDAMHRRRQLSERQFRAALRFRDAFEACAGAIGSPLDTSRMGGGTPSGAPPLPAILLAAEDLNAVDKLFGMFDGKILKMIVGQGFSITETAIQVYGLRNNKPRPGTARIIGRRLNDALDALARVWFGMERRKGGHFHAEGAVPTEFWGDIDRSSLNVAHAGQDASGKPLLMRKQPSQE